MNTLPPLTDGILFAVARLVDDSQSERREPSHADLAFCIDRCGLSEIDPNRQAGTPLGKEKRLRAVLGWAVDEDFEAGQKLVSQLVGFIRSRGGFRPDSPNFVGGEPIRNLKEEFAKEGFALSDDGELRPLVLESLSGAELTDALESYVRRAQKGSEDAALLTGTGKDLLEAVASHVLIELENLTAAPTNFPTLLGQAFVVLDLKTCQHPVIPREPPQHAMQRGLFQAAVAVNTLRNKQGTGHGRPWLPTVTDNEAKCAVHIMGLVAEMMLVRLREM
jgi:hypothetical protein